MGLFKRVIESLFGPNKTSWAINHWDAVKNARLRGDTKAARVELLQVVRVCQEAIESNPKREGDCYVLLTNALIVAPELFGSADQERLTKYAAASIHSWWSLPYKRSPITKNYDRGIEVYEKILNDLRAAGHPDPESTMAEYAAIHGQFVTSLSPGLEMVGAAFYGLAELPEYSKCSTQNQADPEHSSTVPKFDEVDDLTKYGDDLTKYKEWQVLPAKLANLLWEILVIYGVGTRDPAPDGELSQRLWEIKQSLILSEVREELGIEDNLLLSEVREELLRLRQEAYKIGDLSETLGWHIWIVLIYTHVSQFSSLQRDDEYGDAWKEFGKAEAKVAGALLLKPISHAKANRDWDILLLASGSYSWAGLSERAEECVNAIREDLSEAELVAKVKYLEHSVNMLGQLFLVNQIQLKS